MTTTTASLDFLKLLAHDVRWVLVTALAESDRRVQELVTLLARPQNLISYHLRLLREGSW
jgi:predicted transcriptional regulator